MRCARSWNVSPAFREIDGALECLDPNGMTLRVQVSQQTRWS
jgi:hypothetical protein